MTRPGYQGGMTFISWLVIAFGLGTLTLVAIRLTPVYIEAYEVGSILQTMGSERALEGSTRREIWETFKKRIDVNDIDYIGAKNVKMNDVSKGLQVIVTYQARVHLLGNLDAVASFRKEAMIRN